MYIINVPTERGTIKGGVSIATDVKKWQINKKAYDMQYKKENIKRIPLNINLNTEKDLFEHLEKHKPINTYIKKLVKDDMNK